jgi:predicted Holliday junction resolvase-like endonuclease
MTDFLKQDIFFFITSIAVIILTLLLAILIFYIIKISKNIKYISERAKTEADLISEDISNLRDNVKEHGAKFKYFASFFSDLAKKANKKK